MLPKELASLAKLHCPTCHSFMVLYKESEGAVKLTGLVCPLEHQIKVAVVLYEDELELVNQLTSLQRCPHCGLTQVGLTSVKLNQEGRYLVSLACSACEGRFETEVSDEVLAAFLHNIERDKMEREIRNFSIALEERIIEADDFQ